jgi:hypothetical protein
MYRRRHHRHHAVLCADRRSRILLADLSNGACCSQRTRSWENIVAGTNVSTRQKQSTLAVLCAQGAGWHMPDEAAHLLSVRYQHWSRYAVPWSRVMADADAMHLYHHQTGGRTGTPKTVLTSTTINNTQAEETTYSTV